MKKLNTLSSVPSLFAWSFDYRQGYITPWGGRTAYALSKEQYHKLLKLNKYLDTHEIGFSPSGLYKVVEGERLYIDSPEYNLIDSKNYFVLSQIEDIKDLTCIQYTIKLDGGTSEIRGVVDTSSIPSGTILLVRESNLDYNKHSSFDGFSIFKKGN